jgi:hypothetical protein
MAKAGFPGTGIAKDLFNASEDISDPGTTIAGANPLVNSGESAAASTVGVTSFLGFISSRAGLVRIVEGIVGSMLIIVGVAEFAKGTPVGNVAGKAAKLAMIAK